MKRYIDLDQFISALDAEQNKLMSDDDSIWERDKPIFKGLAYARRIAMDMDTLQLGFFQNNARGALDPIYSEKPI